MSAARARPNCAAAHPHPMRQPRTVATCRWPMRLALLLVAYGSGMVHSAVLAQPAVAEAGPSRTNVAPVARRSEPPLTNTVPEIRRLFFFEPDGPRLVPSSYRAVDAKELDNALAAAAAGTQGPRLTRARYVAQLVGDTLTSERSLLEVQAAQTGPSLLPLVPWNLAVESRDAMAANDPLPITICSDLAGNVMARVAADGRGEFAWSARGTGTPRDLQFALRVPPCIDAQCWFWLPEPLELTADELPVRSHPQLPEELAKDRPNPDEPGRWWQLAAAGRSELNFRVSRRPGETLATQPLLLRGMTIEYQAQPQALTWTAKLQLEPTAGSRDFSSYRLRLPASARIASIRVGSSDVPWQVSEGEQQQSVTISRAPPLDASSNDSILTLEGVQTLRYGEPLELVVPRPEDVRLIWMTPAVELRIRLDPQLQLTRLRLPEKWTQATVSNEGYRLLGEDLGVGPSAAFLPAVEGLYGKQQLRIDWQDGVLRGRWDAELVAGPDIGPLTLTIQPSWDIESILFVDSQRSVSNSPREDPDGVQRLQLWPQPSDFRNDRLRIRINGSRSVDVVDNRLAIEPQWFLRSTETRGQLLTAVVLPPELSVIPSAELAQRRLNRDQIDRDEWIQSIPARSLLFGGPQLGAPKLELIRQLDELQAESLVVIDGQASTLDEEIRITFRPSGGPLDSIEVHVAQQPQRSVQWRLEQSSGQESSASKLLAEPLPPVSGDVQRWQIRFQPPARGPATIVGRVSLGSESRIRPARVFIPRASSHQAFVWLNGGQWDVAELTGDVRRLPTPKGPIPQQRFELSADGQSTLVLKPTQAASTPTSWLLREQLDVAVDPAGWEWVETRHWAPAGQGVQIVAETGISLLEVHRDDQRLPLVGVDWEDGILRLPASDQPTVWRAVWRRAQSTKGMAWWWKPPNLRATSEVVDRRLQLWLGPDVRALGGNVRDRDASWLPIPWRNRGWPATESPIRYAEGLRAGRPWRVVSLSSTDDPPGTWLARTAWLQGLLLGIALIALGFGWWLAQRQSPLALILPVAASPFALWPDNPCWPVVIVALPLWWLGVLAGWFQPSLGRTRSGVSSRRGTLAPTVTAGCIVLLGASLELTPASAQTPPGGTLEFGNNTSPLNRVQERGSADGFQPSRVFDILLPMDAEGRMVGSRVYVPRPLFMWLDRVTRETTPPTQVLSADYRFRIAEPSDAGPSDDLRLLATWRIDVSDLSQAVRLPVLCASARPPEVTVDGSPVALRWTTAGPVWQPSRPGVALVEMSMRPTASRDPLSGRWRLSLDLPPNPSATLTVDYGSSGNDPRVEGVIGRVTYDALALQLKAALGPADRALITWQSRQRSVAQAPGLSRAAWFISARTGHQAHEVQLTFDRAVQPDEVVEVLVDRDEPPLLLGTAWRSVGSSMVEGRRRRLNFQAVGEVTEPLRLLWVVEVSPRLLAIPTPRSADGTPPSSTTVALSLPAEWTTQLNPDGVPDEVAQASASDFLRGWTGPAANISTAYSWTGSRPLRLDILARAPQAPAVEAEQIWTMEPEGIRLRYQVRGRPRLVPQEPPVVQLPPQVQISDVRHGGTTYPIEEQTVNGNRELVLPVDAADSAQPFTIDGWLPTDPSQPSEIPVVRLLGFDRVEQSVEIRKSAVLDLEPIQLAPEIVLQPAARWVLRGDLTISLFRDQVDNLPPSWGTFRRTSESEPFESRLVTAVRPERETYAFRARLELTGSHRAGEFLSLDMPSAWSSQLAIDGPVRWQVDAAPMDGRLGIHILLQEDRPDGVRIELSGKLAPSSATGTSVPSIRTPNIDRLQRLVILPTLLNGERLVWEMLGTQPIVIPDSDVDLVDPTDSPMVLEVLDPQAPLRMRPSDTVAAREEVLLADIGIFESQTSRMLLMAWDVIPGDRSTWRVRVPKSLKPLSASCQGMPVSLRGVNDDVWEVPLAFSRLAQRIELALEVPPSIGVQNSLALPRPVDGLPTTSLLTFYQPSDAIRTTLWDLDPETGWLATSEQRANALRSGAAITAAARAADLLFANSRAEAMAWFQPWSERISLADSDADIEAAALAQRYQSALEKLRLDRPATARVVPQSAQLQSQGWRATSRFLYLGDQPGELSWQLPPPSWRAKLRAHSGTWLSGLSLALALLVWMWNRAERPVLAAVWIVAGVAGLPVVPLPIAILMIGSGMLGLVRHYRVHQRNKAESGSGYELAGLEYMAGTSSRASI